MAAHTVVKHFPVLSGSRYRYTINPPSIQGACPSSFKVDMIEMDVFLLRLDNIMSSKGKSMLYYKLALLNPEFIKIFHDLYYCYISLVAELPSILASSPKHLKDKYDQQELEIKIFIYRVASFRVMIDIVTEHLCGTMRKNANFIANIKTKEELRALVDRHLKPIVHFHRLLSTLNEFASHFNIKYKMDIMLFKETNKHSSVGNLNLAAEAGHSMLLQGMANPRIELGYEMDDKITWLVLHETRRRRCMVPLGPIISMMQHMIRGKELEFAITDSQDKTFKVGFKCPCNIGIQHQVKKGLDVDDAPMIPCGAMIDLSRLHNASRTLTGTTKIMFTPDQKKEYLNFYKLFLQEYSQKTPFPTHKIIFCPKETCCLNTHGFLSRKNKLMAKCPECYNNCMHMEACNCKTKFCTVCNVFQDHPENGIMCNQAAVERLKELGSDVCLCPSFPQCTIPITRSDGCDKLICAKANGGCGTSFCWLCKMKTGLQLDNLIEIEKEMETKGRSVVFASSHQSYLYIHIKNGCKNASYETDTSRVFHPEEIIERWVRNDIVYTSSRTHMSESDSMYIIQRMRAMMAQNFK